jgi:ribosylpyrimidine nucleosidase
MKKIILDCDPGHDDAFAILLASKNPEIDLLGITVVSGNQTLEKTGVNTLNLCQYLDIDVPVCLGSSRPIIKEEEVCEVIHGKTGLDGFSFPKLKLDFDQRKAVDFIIETLLSAKEKISLVTTGPMTNLALAMRVEPKIIDHIEQVIFMGGSIANGNVSPAAEFNIYSDPEAAYIVLESGLKCIMVGLDVTRKVLVEKPIIERMRKHHNKASKLFVDLMEVYNQNQRKVFGFSAGPLHDPITIAYLIQPSILKLTHVNCEIDISHGPSYGRTNIDMFDYRHRPKNMYVASDVDVDAFWDLMEETIKMYGNDQ